MPEKALQIGPAIRTNIASAAETLQRLEDNVIDPAVGSLFGAPEMVADKLGEYGVYAALPNWTGIGTEEDMQDWLSGVMQLSRGETETTIKGSEVIPNQVALLPVDENDRFLGRRNMFDMLADPGTGLYAGTIERNGDSRPIFAPASTYFPTSMWPYSSPDGSRYTVHDFGEEPIESDFLGTKPLLEFAMGRKLDKIGAVPGFQYWGDIALGAPVALLVLGAGYLGVKAAPVALGFVTSTAKTIGERITRPIRP